MKISCYFFYSHNTNRNPDITAILGKLGPLQSYHFSQLDSQGSRGNYHDRVYFFIYLSWTSLCHNRNHSRYTSILLIKVIKLMLGIMYWDYLKINVRCVTTDGYFVKMFLHYCFMPNFNRFSFGTILLLSVTCRNNHEEYNFIFRHL